MTVVEVDPGVCRMNATVEVTKVEKRKFKVAVTSECKMIAKMGDLLGEIDLKDVMKPHTESLVYQSASQCRLHLACPVPMAVLKAIEVEAGLALPKSITVNFKTS